MDRNQAKELLPIIKAYVEGKTIQLQHIDCTWQDAEYLNLGRGLIYRIKPEPKYRSFKNAEECLAEMQKHKPFGWVKIEDLYRNIANVTICSITFADNEARDVDYEQAFKNYTFADCTPFGVKLEE